MAHILFVMVGVAGFEPAAHWSQTSCATKLRYTPKVIYNWQGQKDSNPRHVVLETTALPTELYPFIWYKWRRRWDSNPCGPNTNPNGLANRPLQPLEYFSRLNEILRYINRLKCLMAERVGFEPTVPFGITGFQDQLLKPLGHLSSVDSTVISLKMVTHRRFELRTP